MKCISNSDHGPPPQLYIEMETTTPGAIIFYTVGWNGYAGAPTHNGSTPGSGTDVFHNQVGVPYGQTRYYAAVAWTQAEGDSGVEYYAATQSQLVRLLTRGVEPPRVSPYGPEPYASAIPPRELLSGSGC